MTAISDGHSENVPWRSDWCSFRIHDIGRRRCCSPKCGATFMLQLKFYTFTQSRRSVMCVKVVAFQSSLLSIQVITVTFWLFSFDWNFQWSAEMHSLLHPLLSPSCRIPHAPLHTLHQFWFEDRRRWHRQRSIPLHVLDSYDSILGVNHLHISNSKTKKQSRGRRAGWITWSSAEEQAVMISSGWALRYSTMLIHWTVPNPPTKKTSLMSCILK